MRLQAAGREYEAGSILQAGEAKAGACRTQAQIALLQGTASMFSKYGNGGPNLSSIGNPFGSGSGSSGGSETNWDAPVSWAGADTPAEMIPSGIDYNFAIA